MNPFGTRPARSIPGERNLMRLRALPAFIGLWLIGIGSATAGGMVMTDAEFAMLPEYCKQKSNVSARHSASNPAYFEQAGGAYVGSLHHYCWALVNLTRSYRSSMSAQQRTSILSNVVADIDYVFNNHPVTPGNSSLYSEMYTTRGQAMVRLGEIRGAEVSFQEARKLNPKNWRAYFQWAIHLQLAGKAKEASKLVAEGLENAPDSRALKTLAEELQSGRKKEK